MSQFDKDGFYHGFDLKEKGARDDGFYHGYDDNNHQGDGFYHSYDDSTGEGYESPSEQMDRMIAGYRSEHSLPKAGYESPSDQMDRMVADYRSEHSRSPLEERMTSVWTENSHQRAMRKASSYESMFPGRDAMSENVNDAQVFRQLYPDARLTTVRDVSVRAILFFFVGIALVFGVINSYANDTRSARISQERLASYTAVEGTVDKIQKKPYTKRNRQLYKIEYIYQYEGKTYHGFKEISESRALKMGYGQSEIKREITVYVNPKNPSTSMLYAREYPSPLYCLLAVLGVLPIGYAVYHYRNCASGKYITFTTQGTYVNRVRRYKKVSSFRGVDPSAWKY